MFISRIPSMVIMDLVKAVAPDCDVELTGIRSGKKLHETLLSVDEVRHAAILEEMFVILPESRISCLGSTERRVEQMAKRWKSLTWWILIHKR